MNNKTLLISLAASMLIGFGACKKDKTDPVDDKKEEVKTGLTVSNKQRAFVGYVGATWCPPCGAYGGPGFKAIQAKYTENDVVGLYLAPSGETVPYSTDGSQLIVSPFVNDFYAAMKSSGTIPFYNINGKNEGGAYTTTDATVNKYKPFIDGMISSDASIGIAAKKTLTDSKISCEVKVKAFKAYDADLYYSVLVIEKKAIGLQLISGKPNDTKYEHHYMTRASLIGDGTMKGQVAFESMSSGSIDANKEFTKTFSLNYENLETGTAKLIRWNYTQDNTVVIAMVWKKEAGKYNFVNAVVAE